MMNRRRKMIYHTLWTNPDEEKEIKKIFKKDVKDEEDLKILGDFFCQINLRGDYK